MHRSLSVGEVGRRAEEGQRQILDVQVAELGPQQAAHPAARDQRHQGKCVVPDGVAGDERAAHAFEHLGIAPPRSPARTNDRPDAGGADGIHRQHRRLQRAQHADVSKTARASARQHNRQRATGQQTHDPRQVVGVSDVMVTPHLVQVEPAARSGKRLRPSDEHQLDGAPGRAGVQVRLEPVPGPRLTVAAGEQ